MVDFWKTFVALTAALLSFVRSEDIKLPDGNTISSDLLQTLQSAHGLARNQQVQQQLFLSLPLVAENQISNGVGIANGTLTVSTPSKIRSQKARDAKTLSGQVDKRQVIKCNGPLLQPGDDPCAGQEGNKDFAKCHCPSMFTREWFIRNADPKPTMNDCLFYTFGLSDRANDFVEFHNFYSTRPMMTIWMIWQRKYFDWDTYINNPMRCIIQDDINGVRNPIRQAYFEAMSASMAYMCGGKAAVMDENIALGKSGNVYKGGIWEKIEFPMLKNGADKKYQGRVCDSIDAIGQFFEDPDLDKSVFWENWWTRASGLDWANEATKPFCLQENGNCAEDVKRSERNATERRKLHKRLDWDTSIFDKGGRLEILW